MRDLLLWGSLLRRRGEDAIGDLEMDGDLESSPGCSSDKVDSVLALMTDVLDDSDSCSMSSSEDSEIDEPVSEKSDWLMSECATVYLTLTISSTRGVRKDTLFSAGNRGRIDILRMFARGSGLFARTELSTCDIEYGIVAELHVDAELAELTEDELGVLASVASASSVSSEIDCAELSMHNRGLTGRPVGTCGLPSGSYPFAKVLIAVGDTADSVSNRKLEPFPNVLACDVLRESLGRDCRESVLGSEGCVRNGGVTTMEVVILLEVRAWWWEND